MQKKIYITMLKKCFGLCLFIVIGIAQFANAQDATLKGVLKDEKETLIGAVIQATVNGAVIGAVTDLDGSYSLQVPAGTHSFKFTYTGLQERDTVLTFNSGETKLLDLTLREKANLLNAVSVTGTKNEKPASKEVVSLTVIKPSLVENNNSTSADKAIERVPGVNVIDGQANIRGGSGYSYGAGSRVMLLVDNLPMLRGDAGFPSWSFIPVENLSQMEIVKGASSVLYGSSALNGIINILSAYPTNTPVTKVSMFGTVYGNPRQNGDINGDEKITPADSFYVFNDVQNGSNGVNNLQVTDTITRKAWWNKQQPYEAGFTFAHRQKFGQLDVVLGSYIFSQNSWRQGEYEQRGRVTSNFRYRFKNVPGLTTSLNFNFQTGSSVSFFIWNGMGANAYRSWTAIDNPINKTLRFTIDPSIEYFALASGFKVKWVGRWFKNNSRNNTNQSTLSDLYYNELQLHKHFEDQKINLIFGGTMQNSTVDAELYGNKTFTASNKAVYLQADKEFFGKLNITVGGRYEMNQINDEKREGKPVFRAGLNYQPAKYTFIRASYGQGYRYPTIAEKFVRTDLGAVELSGLSIPVLIAPNPNLKSETGWSAELGVKQGVALGDWKGFVDLATFINDYSNMMEFTFSSFKITPDNQISPLKETIPITDLLTKKVGVGFQSRNIGNTRITGIDATFMGQGNLGSMPTTLITGYTYINPIFKDWDKGVIDTIAGNPVNQDSLSSADYNVLKYRFRHTAKFDIQTQVTKKIQIGLGVNYSSYMEAIDRAFERAYLKTNAVGTQFENFTATVIPELEKYRQLHKGEGTTVIDLRLGYNFTSKATLSLIIKNLFNNEYAYRPALIDAPRNFTLRFAQEF